LVVWDTTDEDEENDEIGTELSPMHHEEEGEIEPPKIQIKEKKEKTPKIHGSKKENNGKTKKAPCSGNGTVSWDDTIDIQCLLDYNIKTKKFEEKEIEFEVYLAIDAKKKLF